MTFIAKELVRVSNKVETCNSYFHIDNKISYLIFKITLFGTRLFNVKNLIYLNKSYFDLLTKGNYLSFCMKCKCIDI